MSLKGMLKFLIIGFVGLSLWIALVAVMGAVSERSHRRAEVYTEMEQTTAGSQVVVGPILVLPYEVRNAAKDDFIRNERYVFPKHLTIDGQLQTESRFRSLYEILLYSTQLKLDGHFEFSEPRELQAARWLQPYLVVLVQDSRGLSTIPLLSWNDSKLPVKPGHHGLTAGLDGGFHADLPTDVRQGGKFPFSIALTLRGMQALNWVPVGDETKVRIHANWPHPSFQGRGLPITHTITDKGFEATWESTHFSTNIAELINEKKLQVHQIGVRFIQPVDIYLQAERSVKYGFLFIALTFAAFLLFETIKRIDIHPVQYGLVGLALVLFYVLLLALSEHVAFIWAYSLASLASVGLLVFYVRYVMGTWQRSIGFALSLSTLYAVIYGILMAEDYALLYGACLLFALLAAAMVVTRRVNWNEVKLSA